ncbi:hypothetical protein DFS34DRAFT_628869 [Phlyctochytrium arcticum]|nr:hypothetical protein DFS34DRAFT_628869 [Phlyctochytrium arcticum]
MYKYFYSDTSSSCFILSTISFISNTFIVFHHTSVSTVYCSCNSNGRDFPSTRLVFLISNRRCFNIRTFLIFISVIPFAFMCVLTFSKIVACRFISVDAFRYSSECSKSINSSAFFSINVASILLLR